MIEITATGVIMIIAIGSNLIGTTKIKVANLLPAIVVAVLLVSIMVFKSNLSLILQVISQCNPKNPRPIK